MKVGTLLYIHTLNISFSISRTGNKKTNVTCKFSFILVPYRPLFERERGPMVIAT